jgi:CHAT domain-containing protein
LCAFLLILHLAHSQNIRAQTTSGGASEVVAPETGKALSREIAGGEKQSYSVDLKERDFLRVRVTQTNTKVGINLQLPDGEVVLFYEPFEGQPELSFAWVAEKPGTYHILINAAAKAPPGRYEIKLLELRAATADELVLQQARVLFNQYARLNRDGRRDEALTALLRCLELREKILGPDDPLVGRTLGFLAALYTSSGDYVNAEPLLIRQIQISEKLLGPDNVEVAREIGALGETYLGKGDDLKAEEATQRALGIYERAKKMESPGAASALSALAGIYYQRRDYAGAENYYERSRAVWEKLLGAEHFHLAPSYTHLGRVAYDAGNYAKAESMFARALALAEKGVGPHNINVTPYRNDLAAVYCTTGAYDKGIALYRQSLAVHTDNAAMGAPSVQEVFTGLSRCAAAQGRNADAVKFLSEASELQERYIEINLATGSEREKLAFLNSLLPRLSRNVSAHINLAPDDPRARDLAALTILRQKGRVQDAVSATLAELHRRSNSEDQELFDSLSSTTAQLARLVLNGTPSSDEQAQLKALEERKEKLEEEISVRSEGYYRPTPVTLKAIQAVIPDEAALIEFITYWPFDSKAPENDKAYGAPRYAAYVFRKNDDVRWAELGRTRDLDDTIVAWRQALRDPQRKDAQQLARAIDEKMMRPVRALVGAATHLLISPDGELNLIPFGALVDEQGRYLVQNYATTYLTSGRDLLRMKVARESKSNALVVAAPLFGEPTRQPLLQTTNLRKTEDRASKHRSVTSASSLADTYFAPLDGTELEARSIQKFFPDANVVTGAQATEEAVKQANAPRILHLATHGFFLSQSGSETRTVPTGPNRQPSTSSSTKVENPLLRSGLAFAGANLRNGKGDDGILTALEASGLNLWGTKLVVLSACDTGLGEVHNGEGVYGLRRAFVLAGAESLVMSLWPISDYTTRTLMTSYYQNLKAGMGRGEALRQVQLDMLKKNPKLHPFYWANFIQAGEWANLDGER